MISDASNILPGYVRGELDGSLAYATEATFSSVEQHLIRNELSFGLRGRIAYYPVDILDDVCERVAGCLEGSDPIPLYLSLPLAGHRSFFHEIDIAPIEAPKMDHAHQYSQAPRLDYTAAQRR